MPATAPHLGRWLLAAYALPGVALAMPTIPAYVYLPAFYASDLGVGLAATGAALFAARALDVLTDPLIGVLSDHTPGPFGRRRPWMAGGAVLAAIALVQLFSPSGAVGAGHLLLWSALLYLGWTMVSIPYSAWAAELTGDYYERARLTAAREAAMLIGILIAAAVPAVTAADGAARGDALATIAWLAIGLGGVGLLIMLPAVPERRGPERPAVSARVPWRHAVGIVLGNRPFARLLAAWFVNGFANGLPAALFVLFMTHVLQADETQQGVLVLVYFLAGVAGMPVWVALSRKWGKHRAWCAAMGLASIAFVWAPWLGAGDVWPFLVVCVVTGFALGADLALPPAMQADVVDLDTLRSGAGRAGLFFALWGMATKLAMAAAVGVAFLLLDVVGFDPAAPDPHSLWVLAALYALVPVVLKTAAIAIVWNHPVTARRQAVIRRRLDTLAVRAERRATS